MSSDVHGGSGPMLVIACGALAREILSIKARYGWDHLHLTCIDARLHNQPARIPDRLRAAIRKHRPDYASIFVAYGDCGTAGGIDRVLDEEGVERLPGAHCYEFLAGASVFSTLSDEEPGTFYLTDFLARHFERLVVKPLRLDTNPELRDAYFGNYRRLVYLSQTANPDLLAAARIAAERLSLSFEHRHSGYGSLESTLIEHVSSSNARHQENARLLA